MNYITITNLPEINLNEIDGSEDIILTKNTDSKKINLDTLYNYINQDILIDLDQKVDKVQGKQLSDINFTQFDKNKLDGISENANNYMLPISTDTTLGGVKKGNYIDISQNGVISVSENVQVQWGNIQNKPEIIDSVFVENALQTDSSSVNTPNLLVRRDENGNFAAGIITANIQGNSTTANRLNSSKTFTISGDVSGTASSNLSSGVEINVSVVNDSHNHTINTIDNLQTVLDSKISSNEKGSVNGVATLDSNGKIQTTQLPSYVDDVLEFSNLLSFPELGESGKIYVALDTNKTYRWSGSAYIYITSGAVDSVNGYTGIINLSKSDIGLGDVDNTSDINKPISTSTQTALDLKADKSTTLSGYNITDAYTKTEVQTVLPKVGFDTTNSVTPNIGQLAWNTADGTVDIGLSGAVLQIGQEQLIKVRNNSGSIIQNGKAIMATGTLGNSGRITAALANLNQSNAKMILGIATEDIAIGADGFCTTFGKIRQIQTNGANYGETWVDGDILYVKDSDAGSLTKITPSDLEVKLPIAIVVHAHASNGTLFVRVNSIDENHAKYDLSLKLDKNSNIVAGTSTKITYDSKGLVTSGGSLSSSDIPNLDTSKLTSGTLPVIRGGTGVTTSTGSGNVVLSTSPTLVTPNIGVASGTSFNSITGLSSTTPVVAGTATIGVSTTTARADHVHPAQTTITGNAGTATKLETARTINGVSFDGTANISISSEVVIANTEFITGVKRDGKTVYGIEVDIGALPNTTFKDVSFTYNATYNYWVDTSNSYSTNGSEVVTLPYFGYIGDGVSVKLDRTNNKITIIADKDRSAFTTSRIVLNYTK